MKRTFEALTTVVSVTVDDQLPVHALVDALLAGYPPSERTPELAFRLRGGDRPAVVCEGRYETGVEHLADLVPLFELDLYQALAEHAAPGWLLHAAALERDGRTIVLAGPSGAGKTTLSLALVARGWHLATDEMVLVGRDRLLRGLARPIHLTAASPLRGAIPAGWTETAYPIRGASGEIENAIVQPAPGTRITSPLPLDALARIGHEPNASPRVDVLPSRLALSRLWDCTLRRDDDGLAAGTALVAAHRVFEVCTGSVADSVNAVERLFAA